MNTLENKM